MLWLWGISIQHVSFRILCSIESVQTSLNTKFCHLSSLGKAVFTEVRWYVYVKETITYQFHERPVLIGIFLQMSCLN